MFPSFIVCLGLRLDNDARVEPPDIAADSRGLQRDKPGSSFDFILLLFGLATTYRNRAVSKGI
jgi:hypothetical protein